MVENWNKDWTGSRTFYEHMLRFWNHPSVTAAAVSPIVFQVTTIHRKVFIASDKMKDFLLTAEGMFLAPRRPYFFRSLPLLDSKTHPWILVTQCPQLLRCHLCTAIFFINSNKHQAHRGLICPWKCNSKTTQYRPAKHQISIAQTNHLCNRRA